MDDIDRALTRLFVLIVIVVAIVGVWAIGMYMSTKTYHGCTVTGTDPNGEFGGHFYEVSCGNGVTFSNVAGGVSEVRMCQNWRHCDSGNLWSMVSDSDNRGFKLLSINTRSKTRRILRHWRKGIVILGAIILSPSAILFAFYLGFWLARYTYGLKIIRTKKEVKK